MATRQIWCSITCVCALLIIVVMQYHRTSQILHPVSDIIAGIFGGATDESAHAHASLLIDNAITGFTVKFEKTRIVPVDTLTDALSHTSTAPAELPHNITTLLSTCHTTTTIDQYAVVTTIADEPTAAMLQLAYSGEWCIIVIGDVKSPASFKHAIVNGQQNDNIQTRDAYNKLIFLDVSQQELLPYKLIGVTPTSSFSRKNIGFLLAVSQHPTVIYDFDDNNIYVPESMPSDTVPSSSHHHRNSPPVLDGMPHDFIQQPASQVITVSSSESAASDMSYLNHAWTVDILTNENQNTWWNITARSNDLDWLATRVVNPYPHIGLSDAWPRGYPIQSVYSSTAQQHNDASDATTSPPTYRTCVPVIQQLGQGRNPDVDSVYRIKHGVPADFLPWQTTAESYNTTTSPSPAARDTHISVASPSGVYTPYNAQATMHLPSAYHSMLLPKTVHERVADIWRSYVVQTLMTYNDNECVVFTQPHVDNQRTPHDFQHDFNNELPLYQQTPALLHLLTARLSHHPMHLDDHIHPSLATHRHILGDALTRFVQLYIDLYEYGVLELPDVEYAALWAVDLAAMHAQLPIPAGRQTDRAVCIMFNWEANPETMWPLLYAQRRMHQYIAIIADKLTTASYVMPYGVHAIECNSEMGYRQHICHSRCFDFYGNASSPFAQQLPDAASKLQGVVIVADDAYVNYTTVLSTDWPPDRAWIGDPTTANLTFDLGIPQDMVWWWPHEHLGGFAGVIRAFNRLAEHPTINAGLQAMFGNKTMINQPVLSDVYYVPMCGVYWYAEIVQMLSNSTDPRTAVSFCEMITPFLQHTAVQVGCNDSYVIAANAAILWSERRSVPVVVDEMAAGRVMIHPVKLAYNDFREVYLAATSSDWSMLQQQYQLSDQSR